MAMRSLMRRAARQAAPALRSSAAVGAVASPFGAQMLMRSRPAVVARGFAKAAKKGKGGGGGSAAAASAASEADSALDGAATLDKAQKNMDGAVVHFTRALSQMRPGRADAGIFDELRVQAYGQHVPLAQLAQVAVTGAHSLSVTVYDPSVRSIQISRLGNGMAC